MIRGEIEIKRFVLVEPDILIETDQAGRSNLVFEKSGEVSSVQPKGEISAESSPLPRFSSGAIEIEGGVVAYQDGASGKTDSVVLEHLTATASGPDQSIQLRGKGAANGASFDFSGEVGPLFLLTQPGRSWPVKLAATATGVTLKVDGEIRDGLHASDTIFNIEARGETTADLARLAKVENVPELGPVRAVVKIVSRNKSLSIESLDIDCGSDVLAAFKFTGSIKDPLAQRGVDLDVKIYGKDLAMVGRLAGRPLPIPGPFQVSGHVNDLADRVYQLSDLKVSAGENDLAGSLQLDLRAARPGVKGTLSSNQLDLRPLLAKEKDEKPPTARSGRVFPAEPLSLEALNRLNADLQIHARRIFTPRLAIDDLTVGLVLADGALTLDPLKAGVGGGTLDGRIGLRAREKGVGVEAVLKANRVDVDLVARELGLTEKPGGKLDLDLNLKGDGGSVAEIMAGVTGKTLLVMTKGRIQNKYLDLLGADVGSSTLRLLNPFSQETQYVEINCFVSGFDVRAGIAQSTALVLDTNHVTVVGEGKINLKSEELDLSFKPSPKEGVGISGLGKISLNLGELARPFKLGGTLAKPTMVFDLTQAALSIGRALGGAALFGPAGIAAYLSGGPPTEGNACLAALDASKKGVKPAGGIFEEAEGTARKAVEATGDKLRKMFGK